MPRRNTIAMAALQIDERRCVMQGESTTIGIPTYHDMLDVHERISRPHINRTKKLTSAYRGDVSSARLFFQCEDFQLRAAAEQYDGVRIVAFYQNTGNLLKLATIVTKMSLAVQSIVCRSCGKTSAQEGTPKVIL